MSRRNRAPASAVKRLPEALIDQIAAGEVVERPASVVKELVENALDAGAERIRVEVRDGGRAWIAVTDDGTGMRPEDARLALQRHATSKIGSAEDLHQIHTYGFRGEALPAIASVSRLRLRTRARDAELAFELRGEGGRIEERAVGGPPGTRVEIADLFATVPARRKFLKAASTEWGHIADGLSRGALARPDVHFDVRRDERPALVWPATRDPLDRVAAVVSEDDAAAFVAVAAEEGGASVRGFASRPDRHRPNLSGVYLYVNGRPVRDRVLQHALVDVYRDVLPRGRFPAAVLFLTLPPEAVDVNVHPAKWEVRFADPQGLHRLVRSAVRGAIEDRRWLQPGPARTGEPIPSWGSSAVPAASGDASRVFRGDWIFADAPRAEAAALAGGGPDESRRLRFADLRLLGQLLATYLVLEGKDGLLLIDQHAGHERVLYERLRAEWIERGVERQGLLMPLSVQLAPAAHAALVDSAEALARLGFELESFGEETVVLRSIPALLEGRDPATLLRGLADELQAAGATGGGGEAGARALESADRLFASLACHSARRKGEVLDEREQRALLDGLDAIPWAPTCPHGRPVAVPFELAEIERRFGRR